MENEIEVGEYVRTKKGILGKLRGQYTYKNGGVEYPAPQEWVIDRFNNKNNYYVINEADVDFDEIVNHSDNPRDLIVVGDLVKMKDSEGEIHWFEVYDNSAMYQYEILEIVTKEKMENESYKIQEQN